MMYKFVRDSYKFSATAALLFAVASMVAAFCGVPAALAQVSGPPSPELNSAAFWSQTFLYLLVGWLIFHLLVIRPAALKHDSHKKFMQSLKKGDEVVVNGAFLGKVNTVKPDIVVVEISSDCKMRVLPAAIAPKADVAVSAPAKATKAAS